MLIKFIYLCIWNALDLSCLHVCKYRQIPIFGDQLNLIINLLINLPLYSDKDKDVRLYINNYDCISSWKFNSALGELRGTFGIMIAQIAVAYGINVEEELASILPNKEE